MLAVEGQQRRPHARAPLRRREVEEETLSYAEQLKQQRLYEEMPALYDEQQVVFDDVIACVLNKQTKKSWHMFYRRSRRFGSKRSGFRFPVRFRRFLRIIVPRFYSNAYTRCCYGGRWYIATNATLTSHQRLSSPQQTPTAEHIACSPCATSRAWYHSAQRGLPRDAPSRSVPLCSCTPPFKIA